MICEKIRNGIACRASVDDEWDYGVKESWKNVLAVMAESIEETLSFIENDCTSNEFSWLSEIFNDIVEIFPDKRIIDTLRKTAKKYPEEVEKYNINYCIDLAENHLDFLAGN